MRRVAVALAAAAVLVRPAPVAADPSAPHGPVAYRPPVDAAIVDPYRPPPEPWAPGNRGVDYGTTPGTPVRAAADGEVVFAGDVAGSLHVVLLHADGIRTSYSFLRSITVHRGERVVQGQPVGISGERFHFGARAGDAYIDPTRLFGDGPPEVHLVPDEDRRPASVARERSALARFLSGVARGVLGPTTAAMAWVRGQAVGTATDVAGVAAQAFHDRLEELRGVLHDAWDTSPYAMALRLSETVDDWRRQRHACTPESMPPPPRPAAGHIAVEVAGLDSTSERQRQHVTALDTGALGYGPDDVVRFSYAGGNADANPYTARDTGADIRRSAYHLRQLLETIAAQHPGVPVDLIAHSEGGIVARQALAQEADPGDGGLPTINALVLLGAPNTGADLGTAAVMAGKSAVGELAESAASAALPDHVDVRAVAVHQLAETSTLLARLNHTPLPQGVFVTSIGARYDPVVPSGHTRLEGAHNVVVDTPLSLHAHSELPGSSEARREVALAVARMPPTCRTFAHMLVDAAATQVISGGEDTAGLAAWAGGRWVDTAIAPALIPTKVEARP